MNPLSPHPGPLSLASRRVRPGTAGHRSPGRWVALIAVCLALAGCQDVLGIDPVVADDPDNPVEPGPCATSGDSDGDGVCDPEDRCEGDDRLDGDSDGVPDECDVCPLDNPDDSDGDDVCDSDDQCQDGDDGLDSDEDGVPDACDLCPEGDDGLDGDGDGVPDLCDVCPEGDDGSDSDSDGVPDGCDICPEGDDNQDSDEDGVPDGCERCPGSNDSVDRDGDGIPDGCDSCPSSGPFCRSCAEILAGDPTAGDGPHVIDPDGLGPGEVRVVECDMTSNGGGWTVMALWDREADPAAHTLDSLLAQLADEVAELGNPNISPMGDFSEQSDHVRWSDLDITQDALSLRLDIDIPNNGELLLDIAYRGFSMENSAVWFFATTATGPKNIFCAQNDTDSVDYTDEERGLIPYACGSILDPVLDRRLDQREFGEPVSTFHLRSLHHDLDFGDQSQLRRLIVRVR